jgi:hypothetical protein
LYTHRPVVHEREDEAVANRQFSSLLAIAVVLVLLIMSLFLVQRLHSTTAVEDCIMSGRTNCETLVLLRP